MKNSIDPAFIREHKKNQTLELSRRSLTSVGAHIVLFIFVALITPLHSDHPMLLTLFGALICFISIVRLILAKKVPKTYDQNPILLQTLFKSLNYVSGALWGILAFISAQFYPLEWPFMFILIINCGLAAGATSSLGPDYGLSRNFTLLIIMPIAAWGFLNGSTLGIGVGILCLFCAFMFIRMAKDNAFWYWENIENNVRVRQNTDTMADLFKKVMENARSLNRSSQDLTQFSGEMKSNAGDMSGQLNRVVDLTQEVIGNSDTVVGLMDQSTHNFSNIASASEEMTSTITDIAQSTQTTHDITAKAVEQSEKAVKKMKILDDSATAINKITETIGEISEQINLLALNATIEAARAGEAGKGFAVVASEIKELAIQTSASASEINHQVNDIQASTADTSQQMAQIKKVVMEANQRVEDITHAIDEQSKATKEVSRNINELSQGFSQVTQFISQNDDNLKNTSRHILELQTAADQVKEGALKVDKNAETLLVLASDMTSVTQKKSIMTKSSENKDRETVDDSLENSWPGMVAPIS